MSEALSFRRLGSMLKKLHVRDGDILLVKSGTALANKETIKRIADAIGEIFDVKALVLVVDDLNDLRKINEQALYEYGWVKIDSLAELFMRKRGIDPGLTKSEIKEVMDARKDDAAPEPVQE